MKRILFVDDEPRILEGLENLLRRRRKDWEMVFADGGEAALEHLATRRFDVVVSDMRMPRMDGAELLRRVQEIQPRAVRIILSGQTEQDAAKRVIHTAHQFLSKPCDGLVLQEAIERSCSLTDLLHGEALGETIGRIGQLPTLPAAVDELNRALTDPGCSMKDLASVVERDPALCAKVLQLANSAFFGLAHRVTAIDHAVSYLGVDVLKSLAMMIELFNLAGGSESTIPLERMSEHSLLTARIAKTVAAGLPCEPDAFTAGVLHDVGILVLASREQAQLTAVVQEVRATGRPFPEVEREALGVTHAEIGAYLLGLWGLPLPIVEAVAFHHAPGRVVHAAFDLVETLHVAEALASELDPGVVAFTGIAPIDHDCLSALGVADRLPEWRSAAAEWAETAGQR